MWGFHHVAKKISCSDCGLSIATEPPKDSSSDDSSDDHLFTSDDDNLHNLGFNPLAVVTTQPSNALSDDATTIIASMSNRSSLRAKNQANKISEQIKRQGIAMEGQVRVGASIYIACRLNGMALSIKDICSVSNRAEVSKISSAVRSVVDKLGLPPRLMHIRAAEFAKRYSTYLQMDSQAVKAAEVAAERCTDHVNSSRAPSSVAAAVVYIIAQLSYEKKLLLKDIKEATGLHEVTIKKTYKDLYPYLSKIIPTWFANANDLKKLHSP